MQDEVSARVEDELIEKQPSPLQIAGVNPITWKVEKLILLYAYRISWHALELQYQNLLRNCNRYGWRRAGPERRQKPSANKKKP